MSRMEHRAWSIGLDYFGLRNREPARRVGVRRTIADCGFEKAKSAIENDLAPGFYILTS